MSSILQKDKNTPKAPIRHTPQKSCQHKTSFCHSLTWTGKVYQRGHPCHASHQCKPSEMPYHSQQLDAFLLFGSVPQLSVHSTIEWCRAIGTHLVSEMRCNPSPEQGIFCRNMHRGGELDGC